MRVIETVSVQRFRLDGIEYFKNYISTVAGNQITVYNAYDRNDVRIDWEHFGNVSVNGFVYTNAADLQSALLPVIYTRNSLAPSGGAVTSVNAETGDVIIDGTNINVTNPTTATETTLNQALEDINDASGGTPTFQSVIEAGDELVSDDNLRKIVISKEGQSISFYNRADVGDAWSLTDSWDSISGLTVNNGFLNGIYSFSLNPFGGFTIFDGDGNNINTNSSGITKTLNSIGYYSVWTRVVSSSTTAENDTVYNVVAKATFTDPLPTEGKGYTVFVRNGTATIGGTAYGVGTLVYRIYHSGAWSNTVFVDQTQIGSATQTALNLKTNASRFIYQGKTSVTGVTGETNICSFKIPAGAYSNTDAFKLDFTQTKSVTAATSTFKVYIGTTSGARTNQIASTSLGTTGRSSDNTRRFHIDAGSLDCSVGFATNANSGLGAQTSVNTPISVNMDNDVWVTFTANPGATTETHGVMGVSITPLK